MTRFFTTEFIKDKWLGYSTYTLATLPPDGWIDEVAIAIEERLENWLGYQLGVETYVETHTTDDLGRIQLRKYPVQSIVKVEQLLPRIVDGVNGTIPIPSNNYNAVGSTNQRGIIWLSQPELTIVVEYTAGHLEEPPGMLAVMFAVLMELLKHVTPPGYPDWGFLAEPTRDYTSLSLPGGLSKSFQIGSSGGSTGGVPSEGTIEDRLFAPLNRYRRLYKL